MSSAIKRMSLHRVSRLLAWEKSGALDAAIIWSAVKLVVLRQQCGSVRLRDRVAVAQGEVALINASKRTATVVATTPVSASLTGLAECARVLRQSSRDCMQTMCNSFPFTVSCHV